MKSYWFLLGLLYNKTKYFSLSLSDEVSKDRAERELSEKLEHEYLSQSDIAPTDGAKNKIKMIKRDT